MRYPERFTQPSARLTSTPIAVSDDDHHGRVSFLGGEVELAEFRRYHKNIHVFDLDRESGEWIYHES